MVITLQHCSFCFGMPDLVSNLQEPGRPGDDGGVLQTHNVILNTAKQKLL